jgi:hypothetical protein
MNHKFQIGDEVSYNGEVGVVFSVNHFHDIATPTKSTYL